MLRLWWNVFIMTTTKFLVKHQDIKHRYVRDSSSINNNKKLYFVTICEGIYTYFAKIPYNSLLHISFVIVDICRKWLKCKGLSLPISPSPKHVPLSY
jgi:hypothetical protein